MKVTSDNSLYIDMFVNIETGVYITRAQEPALVMPPCLVGCCWQKLRRADVTMSKEG